jgi:hypothetical protein
MRANECLRLHHVTYDGRVAYRREFACLYQFYDVFLSPGYMTCLESLGSAVGVGSGYGLGEPR